MSVAVSTGDLSGGGLVTLVSTFTKPNIHCPTTKLWASTALPRSDPTTDDLKSRVEFAGGTTVIRVK